MIIKPMGKHFSILKNHCPIDENSASTGKIVAGAIQDWDRGIIIGRRSFGKGLVQEQFPLNNGGAMRLTVTGITPSGESIRDYLIVPITKRILMQDFYMVTYLIKIVYWCMTTHIHHLY